MALSTVETFIGKPSLTIEEIVNDNEFILMQTSTMAMQYLIILLKRGLLDDHPILAKVVKEYMVTAEESRDLILGMFNRYGNDPS